MDASSAGEVSRPRAAADQTIRRARRHRRGRPAAGISRYQFVCRQGRGDFRSDASCFRKCSEYLREHAHWGVFDDPIGIQLRYLVGVNRIMWSTDFPHILTRWPKSLALMEEQFAGVPETEKRAVVAGNAVKLFHLDAV